MARTSYTAEKLAVSFPILVAIMGFVGWIVKTLNTAATQSPQSSR